MKLFRAHQVLPPLEERGLADWIVERLIQNGHQSAEGRWFGTSVEQIEWYLEDNPGRHVVSLEIPDEIAEPFRVANLPREIQRFSRDPQEEFFLPVEWAERAS